MVDKLNTQRLFNFAIKLRSHELGLQIADEIITAKRMKPFQRLYCEEDDATALVRNDKRYPRGVLGAIARALFDNEYTLRMIATHPLAWDTFATNGNPQPLLARLKSCQCKPSPNYIIKTATGHDKLTGCVMILKWFRENMAYSEVDKRLFINNENPYRVATLANWLQEAQYIGPFLAGEIAYELSMQVRQLQPYNMAADINTFATCGHSTLRGVARLYGYIERVAKRGGKRTNVRPSIRKVPVAESLQQILEESRQYFFNIANKDWACWRMREVVRCLALFDQYERLRLRMVRGKPAYAHDGDWK